MIIPAAPKYRPFLVATIALLGLCLVSGVRGVEGGGGDRGKAGTLMNQGNWKDAYEEYRKVCLDAKADAKTVGQDLNSAVQCLRNLGRTSETDEFIEATIKVHAKNWRLLRDAANIYLNIDHYGFLIGGKYERGPHRGGGKVTNSLERDRVRALQLMEQAIPLAAADDAKPEVGQFYLSLAEQFLYNRGFHEAWRLQYLSNLKELPDLDEGYPYYKDYSGAPVDEAGKPVFHTLPKNWAEAATDGQRWRWSHAQAVENNPALLNQVRFQQAGFLQNQFGPETMNQFGYGRHFFGLPQADDETKKDESGTYALHTLGEDETIAKLANGIKRLKLPDEFNYLKLYQQIVAEPKTGMVEPAQDALARSFENRRQYPRAAKEWEIAIAKSGPGQNDWRKLQRQQIVGNWGRFEPTTTRAAGEGAKLEYRYRNAKQVTFTAHALKMDKLLDDVKAYLKGDPGQLDWNKLQIDNIGWRIVHNNEQQYLAEKAAEWTLDLKSRENHFDRRVTVSTPLQKAGAYLVTARLADGNETKIVLWVADTAIVQKQLDGKNYYFVADADGGAPIAAANLEFFGWKQEHLGGNRFKVSTTNFAEKTDADGQIIPDPRDLKTDHQWLITARTGGGRLAYLGFTGVWYNRWYDQEYNTVKIFCITDRPVYRPNQSVHFKMWVGHAQYDNENLSNFAKQSFPVELHDPQGNKVQNWNLTADEYGGIEGNWEIKSDAKLGQYTLVIPWPNPPRPYQVGGNHFRVEEYKKPEFEVSVEAPKEPVMLGEKISATIKAKYYFGSPVVKAKVKYKITRDDHSDNWYPVAAWDWCYGGGYWWYAYDYAWYPGWREWCGCKRPIPWWWYRGRHQPPELVSEQEVEIKPDGTVQVEIDTQVAKALHGDTDHSYSITAEVRDESRRTIVGTGSVLVARKPFKVFSWVDRGYYRVGDTIQANFLAQTLDKKPVQGKGVLTILKITYDKDRKPIETPVRTWNLDTNEEGAAKHQMSASAKGQYRLSYKLTDSKQHAIEGGYLFTIIGDGFDGREYRFNAVELIPEKREYAPGEKVKLQINTERADSTVLLFVRPTNGVYQPPKVVRIKGKSAVEEIEVAKKDMPNFFVEAMTVAGANVHQETKELVVPPEKRVLEVKVQPSATEYKPGQEAKIKVQLTDIKGEPFVGQTVLSVYDKSVEYISGGSNVPDIKEFFWKWRRHHNPQHQSSLARYSNGFELPNRPGMGDLGVFGASVADEVETADVSGLAGPEGLGGGGGRGAMKDGAAAPGKPMAAYARKSDEKAAGGYAESSLRADFGADKAKQSAPMEQLAARAELQSNGAAGAAPVEPTVRTKFADTAFWTGAVVTDKTGIAEVTFKMPENLSGWKMKVWGMGSGTRVGSGEAEAVTRKNLILRLQAPRFFVEKDEVVLSANIHNYLKTDKEVTAVLETPGEQLKPPADTTQKIKIPAGGEKRVDWRCKVTKEGEAVVRMKALTDEESDAMEVKLPSYVHGMLKQESWVGTIRPDKQSGKLTFVVPKERRPAESVLEIRYSPTLAMAMVDALPYLADYPYGCTEQTLNRFLPSVITQKVLREMNVNLAAIRDKRANLNAQEIGDDKERAKQWKRFDRNPVFEEEELNRIVKEGLTTLTNMQCSDGGWGWFSGYGERSWPHTTAVVVHGLQVARQNDLAMVPGLLERGIEWLKRYQAEQVQWLKNAPGKVHPWKDKADALDAFVYMILVDSGSDHKEMLEFLYRDRNDLPVYSKAQLGLAVHKIGDKEKLAMLLKNVEQYLVQDKENESAYLKLPENNYWWYWYGSETEANAYYLKLLAKTDPKGEAAPRLVKYLLNNRKHATYWSNTRDTALCVEAFSDYVRASGEQEPDMTVEVWLDGQKRKEVQIKRENLFTYDNKFVLAGLDVKDGSHELEIRRAGKGPVYFNAYLTNFTLEDHIAKAGLEIKVERKMYQLIPVKKEIKVEGARGQALDQRVEKYERKLLPEGAVLKSGDLVEIELEFESKNDYEYILFEDMKAAGFEPFEVRSGYSGNGLGAYMELRDNRVALFVRVLARGKNSIAYRMRAEIPGAFSALPTRVSAMYAPELKANSDEQKLKIED